MNDISPEALRQLLIHRRTIHLFEERPVSEALLIDALETAIWAPNHRLTEPWRFYLLGPEGKARVIDLNCAIEQRVHGEGASRVKRQRWSAIPGWLVVTMARDDDPVRERENYAACAAGMQNAMLYLWNQGIGMKWTTGPVTRESVFLETVGADPVTEELVGLFWYGYPAAIPVTKRRPLESLLKRRP
jgi:nitroreductase